MAENEQEQPKGRKPWERQPGETSKPYAALCHCRDLGEGRTIRQGVMAYLTGPCPKNAPDRAHQQRRYKIHDRPEAYVEAVRGQWRRWSKRWRWTERLRAYDEWRDAMRQKAEDERAAEVAIQEAEAKIIARQTETEHGREMVKIARRLSEQMKKVLEAGPIEELGLPRYKAVVIRRDEGETQRTETQRPSIMDFAPVMASMALDGQRLQRLAAGEPTEVVQNVDAVVEKLLRAIFEVIRDHVPPELWETAKQRIVNACRDNDLRTEGQ